jgi:hypothetical protein
VKADRRPRRRRRRAIRNHRALATSQTLQMRGPREHQG